MRILLFFCPLILLAQDSAVLSGSVEDPKGAPVPGVTIQIYEAQRNTTRTTTSDETGAYLFDALVPGEYRLVAEKAGFSKITLEHIALVARGRRSVNLHLTLESVNSSVVVESTVEGIQTDPSTGSSISEDTIRYLPVNGRTVDVLVRTAPGVVWSASELGDEINVNGLRSNTNYYTLDGVSLSAGSAVTATAFAGTAVAGAATVAVGGETAATNQVSLDSLLEMRVQTSSFAPEFGRTPGAQIALSSRSGSNQFHGSAFEYYRDTIFNANDWFANAAGLDRGDMRLNQFGGTVGGPIIQDRTFFFGSYEGTRLLEPDTAVVSVPDLSIRNSAPTALQPYLKAFPLPNGPALGDDAAQYAAVFSNPSNRDAASLRIDHRFNDHNYGFVRYSYAPWSGSSRASDFASPNVLSNYDNRTQFVTASLQSTPKAAMTNDLRFNYTWASLSSYSVMDDFGGALPLTDSIFPSGIDSSTGTFNLAVFGLSSYSLGQSTRTSQSQYNVVDGLTMVAGKNQYKIGFDYRWIGQTSQLKPYSQTAYFSGLSGTAGSLASGTVLSSVVTSNVDTIYPGFQNFSMYLQDTYQAGPKTSITVGARWDINPAPFARQGPAPLALSSYFSDQLTQNQPLYDTRWNDVAPRLGFSQQFGKEGHETVFRAGIGIFHDLGYGTSAAAFAGAPYAAFRTLSSTTFPLVDSNAAPPEMPPTTPYGQVSAAQRDLKSPAVYQWTAAIERHIFNNQTLTIGYVGTSGHNLLRTTMQASDTDTYDILRLATNGAESSYHALQVQWAKRLSKNFQAQVNYTYSHSIDTASSDSGFGFATLYSGERGNSDFDVRHLINVTGSYLLPSPSTPVLHTLLKDWWTDWLFTARTGLPFNVVGITTESSSGLFALVRPNYYGATVWLSDPNAPAGQRLNFDAFTLPDDYSQGNLGRNAIRGFGMAQLDFSLRRRIPIGERLALNLMAQAFNITNTPSFANPTESEGANMASPNFGVATRMLGKGLGSGMGTAFRTGLPRSLQFGVRLQF
jgi:hypothetical protein